MADSRQVTGAGSSASEKRTLRMPLAEARAQLEAQILAGRRITGDLIPGLIELVEQRYATIRPFGLPRKGQSRSALKDERSALDARIARDVEEILASAGRWRDYNRAWLEESLGPA